MADTTSAAPKETAPQPGDRMLGYFLRSREIPVNDASRGALADLLAIIAERDALNTALRSLGTEAADREIKRLRQALKVAEGYAANLQAAYKMEREVERSLSLRHREAPLGPAVDALNTLMLAIHAHCNGDLGQHAVMQAVYDYDTGCTNHVAVILAHLQAAEETRDKVLAIAAGSPVEDANGEPWDIGDLCDSHENLRAALLAERCEAESLRGQLQQTNVGVAELRAALRGRMVGKNRLTGGYSCECTNHGDPEWSEGQPEIHAPGCLAATPAGAQS